jgi:hypothetical protein
MGGAKGVRVNALTTTRRIEEAYRSYLRTTFSPLRPAWRDAYGAALQREIELTRGPYLQATPPFAPGASPQDLIDEGLLSPGFERLPADVFPLDRALYVHQERAVRAALAGRNLLVATGTGSGKTECVLIPVVEELLREAQAGTLAEPGVRVLLLYPMNALANDQLRRFRAWLAAFPEITFGRFVGDTRETAAAAAEAYRAVHGSTPIRNELLSRDEMRARPPHILVTNYSMLEYLLLRPSDTPFFDGATGSHWRTVALDEAHVYDGADGAEVAMLLRRLRDRVVGSRRGALRVVATSATLGRGEEDYPTLVRFGSDLFDEPFAVSDVIGPGRLPLVRRDAGSELPAAAYGELAEVLRVEDEHGVAPTPADIARVLEVHDPARAGAARAAADPGRALHDLLVDDRRLVAVQAALDVAGTLTLPDAATAVFGDPDRRADVVDLVDLAVRAREHAADAPLLPARYHYWLRGLEGAFACLHPAHPAGSPSLLLTVAEACPACAGVGVRSAMVELGICRRCRADYAIGLGDLGEDLTRAAVGVTPTAYLLLDAAAAEDDEDDIDADPVALANPGIPAWYCPGCARLLDGPSGPCGCAGTAPARRAGSLVVLAGEEPRIGRCVACASSIPNGNIVGRFLTDAHAPAAVIATALYQDLPVAAERRIAEKAGEGRKLLAFADSRQDAAFFAPYLERTYRRALQRSLLLRAVDTAGAVDGLRPADLAVPLIELADRAGILEFGASAAARRRTVMTWVVEELLATDRRGSLEGTGLVRVAPALPPGVVPAALAPLDLPEPAARDLLELLLDSLRLSGALLVPAGVSRTDAAFEPRNQDYAVRGNGSEKSKQILSWTPARSNRRRALLAKVAAAAGVTIDPGVMLDALWTELTAAGSPWAHLLPYENDRRRGLIRRLDAEGIEFRPAAHAGARMRCDRCRAIWWQDVLGVCPGHNCGGRLAPLAPDAPLGHYADLYRELAPIVLHAKEHTAQWASDKGSDVQQRFLDGDINVLSCSTTFELGVDVGDVEAVLLRNVPPSAANYVQRAGRAGRRASAAALVVTIAQRRNHDFAWFRDPRGMVNGAVMPPRIVTENPIIARRHAHSVALAASLRREEIRTVGDFFVARDEAGATGLDRFTAWLATRPPDLAAALARIIPPAVADAVGVADWSWVTALMDPTTDDPSSGWLGRARDEATSELAILTGLAQDAIAALAADPTDARANAASKTLGYQIRTLRDGRLIEFLARRNVLPKYGFPVDVVELDLSRTGDQAADGIELDRDLRVAIGEYAPGAEVVAAGVVWRSTGLKRFPDRGWPEHGWAVCAACGAYREAPGGDAPGACATCGSPDIERSGRRVRPVFGFYGARSSTVIGDEPVLRRGSTRSWFTDYGPGDPPVFSPPAGLVPGTVETLVSRQGRIVVMNLGPGMRGFRLCGSCGYGAGVPLAMGRGAKVDHVTPYSGTPCKGTVRTVVLSTDFLTDIVEVHPIGSRDTGALRSALYALLEGAGDLGIKRNEVDGTTHARVGGGTSLILYDTVPGGAGHAMRIEDGFAQVVAAAIRRVEGCDCGIETSCYGCLRGYTNQIWHDELTRAGALSVLRPLLGGGAPGPDPGDPEG